MPAFSGNVSHLNVILLRHEMSFELVVLKSRKWKLQRDLT